MTHFVQNPFEKNMKVKGLCKSLCREYFVGNICKFKREEEAAQSTIILPLHVGISVLMQVPKVMPVSHPIRIQALPNQRETLSHSEHSTPVHPR